MQEEKNAGGKRSSEEETYLGDFMSLEVFMVDFVRGLKRFWWTAVVFIAVFCAAAYGHSKKTYVPIYKAEASFSIMSENSSSVGGASSYSAYYNTALANQLSKTFGIIINSQLMRSILQQELGTAALNGTVTAKNSVESAPIFTITVTSRSPQDAMKILQAVIDNYPRLAKYVIGETEMTVFSYPNEPEEPINPFSCKKEIAAAVFAGAAISLFIMALYAFTRDTVRSRGEIREKLNQKCLAEIPKVNVKRRNTRRETMVTISQRNAGFSEAFRYLKRRVVNILGEENAKIVAVTSAYPGEGKTTVSYNLALAISQSGKRTAVLGMDFQRKSLQQYLGADENTRGISDVVAGECSLGSVVCKTESGLDIYYAGTQKAGKTAKADFSELLEFMRENYDYVIIDTPPCALVSDTAQIMNGADKTLFVLRQDYTSLSKVKRSIQYLYDIDAKLMGFVFNEVEDGFIGYKSGYSGSYYGYSKYGYYGKKYGYYGKKYGYRTGYGYGRSYGYDGYGYSESGNGGSYITENVRDDGGDD